MKTILSVVGARPNFMNLAPLHSLLRDRGVRHVVVHTGEHYDVAMSKAFSPDPGIPDSDYNLRVGSVRAAQRIAELVCA